MRAEQNLRQILTTNICDYEKLFGKKKQNLLCEALIMSLYHIIDKQSEREIFIISWSFLPVLVNSRGFT